MKRCKIKWRDVSVCREVVEKGIEIDCIEEPCYNYQEINLNLRDSFIIDLFATSRCANANRGW